MLRNLITKLRTVTTVCLLSLSLFQSGILAQNGMAFDHQIAVPDQSTKSVEEIKTSLSTHTLNHSTDASHNESIVFNTGPYCQGEDIQLVGPNMLGVHYEWTGPHGFHSNEKHPVILDATATNAGVYFLSIKNNSGEVLLQNKGTRVIIAHQPEWIQASNDGPKCEGETIQLFSSTSAQQSVLTYQWTGPNGFSSEQKNPKIENLNPENAGSYYLTIRANGCFLQELHTEVKVNEIPASPMISFTNDMAQENIMLSTDYFEEAQFEWVGPNGFSADHAYPQIKLANTKNSGIYECFVTVNGCTSSAGSSEIIVDTSNQSSSFSCKIPNAISPNNDGKNDVFAIPCLDPSKRNALIIYNQKGQEIYQSNHYQNDWDGTFQGKTLPTGTYFYAIQLDDKKKNIKKGYLFIKS